MEPTISKYSSSIQIAVIILISLIKLEFFKPIFIPEDLRHLLITFSLFLIIGLIIIDLVFVRSVVNVRLNFGIPIVLIFISVFLSFIIAAAFHNQALHISFWANRNIYFFLTYYLLHLLKPDRSMLERLLISFGVINAIFYLAQFFLYPRMLFDVRIGIERNTIRIFLPGMLFMIMAYFLLLHRLFSKLTMKSLLALLLFASVFILTGTRQIIFSILFITFLSILFSKQVKSKFLVFLIAALGMFSLFIAFNDTFMALISATQDQTSNLQEDVRVRSARFFLKEFSPNIYARILGNSESHMANAFGREVQFYKLRYGYYQSDIGLIGDYSKYGILFIIAVFIVFAKFFFIKITQEAVYIKYFVLFIFITSFSGSSIFGIVDYSLIFAMYLFDLERNKIIVANSS
jgi:hypothetical protein